MHRACTYCLSLWKRGVGGLNLCPLSLYDQPFWRWRTFYNYPLNTRLSDPPNHPPQKYAINFAFGISQIVLTTLMEILPMRVHELRRVNLVSFQMRCHLKTFVSTWSKVNVNEKKVPKIKNVKLRKERKKEKRCLEIELIGTFPPNLHWFLLGFPRKGFLRTDDWRNHDRRPPDDSSSAVPKSRAKSPVVGIIDIIT